MPKIEDTVLACLQQLRVNHYSSVELTQFYLDRIKKYNPQLNAFITICEQEALKQAYLADQLRHNTHDHQDLNQRYPLLGLPIAHKDLFSTKNIKTTNGSRILENYIPPYDATVVERLKNAGAVMLGKTNLDEFAMGSSTEHSAFGVTKNPWNLERVAGGSSGGSAAAVAARLIPIATGTDTGGSIRQPAALSGITGLKPTYGRVSRYGMIAFASSLDQAGLMGYNAEDVAYLLKIIAGQDKNDMTSAPHPVIDYLDYLKKNNSIKNLKIGLPKQYFQGVNSAITEQIFKAVKFLESEGAIISEVDLPDPMLGIAAYYIIAPAEASSNLARFDGVRYGYRDNNKNIEDLNELYTATRTAGFGNEVKHRILIGTYVLSSGYYDAYYVKAQKIRYHIQQAFKHIFEQQKIDLLITPVTPTTAFKIGEKTTDPTSLYLEDVNTVSISLAGLPAMSIPVGFSADLNLPVGMQLIGNYFQEEKLLQLAHYYQQRIDFHQQYPERFK